MNTYEKIEDNSPYYFPPTKPSEHLIPEDDYIHIASIGCGCNPQITVAEGTEQYIHNCMTNNDVQTFNKQDNESS